MQQCDNRSQDNILKTIEQFLDYYQFRETLKQFKNESISFLHVDVQEWRPLDDFIKKNNIMNLLRNGDGAALFDAISQIIPSNLLDSRDCRRLEFELHLYLATISWDENNREKQQYSMQFFRRYLESKGALLSQSTDLLPYYALPYVPNPKEHPIYQQLFKDTWRRSVLLKLSALIDSVLLEGKPACPRLIKILTEQNTKRDRVLRQLNIELLDAEKRASQTQRRFSRLQYDYQTLIGVTADLLDALESNLKGIKLEDGVMEKIYARLVNSQPLASGRKLSLGAVDCSSSLCNSFRDNSRNIISAELSNSATFEKLQSWNEKADLPLVELNYEKIKSDIQRIDDRQKCYLLQALRWRLTKSTVEQRECCLTSFVRSDLLDLTKVGPSGDVSLEKTPLLACMQSQHHRVREYMARFVNALSSLCRGRAYLAQNCTIVKLLISELLKEQDESITRENFVGALQKMSLRRPMQTVMINMSVIPWVIHLLENTEALSDYTLEYAVALCMNLCLRTSGKRNCVLISSRILNVLVELLNSDNIDIVPYVNGALYSILALPEIRKVALTMDLQSTLESFIKDDQVEMNRQFEFIIRRLRSNESPPNEDSDDEFEDEDDEEDAPTLESDLDRQDMPPPDRNDLKRFNIPEAASRDPRFWVGEGLLKSKYAIQPVVRGEANGEAASRDPRFWVGEGLLKSKYAIQPVVRGEANGGVDWCKPILSRDSETRMSMTSIRSTGVLRRPITPGQRSARGSISESRPSTADKLRRTFERPSPVTEESTHPLYLRDSLASLSQGFSEENTPRASLQFDSIPTKEADAVPKTSNAMPPAPNPRPSVTNKKSAFESRPKIPRTPETLSPSNSPKLKVGKSESPDSTVSSTTKKDDPRDQPASRPSSTRSNGSRSFGSKLEHSQVSYNNPS
ncbi:LisH domain containing protein ARMC9 [Paragonimus skrjabini miyazakii]|uniref:LisH domain containing protein ARMC9 n=1 Tax=Paragonimus skrjabini miyazakii TaxID=59628 RepID=A0A8S9YMS6_9TREM|nr:LisH domain containing protein ARMC9 [Paragonimus skrjabini miyazakii]